jgi:hypothetical protein
MEGRKGRKEIEAFRRKKSSRGPAKTCASVSFHKAVQAIAGGPESLWLVLLAVSMRFVVATTTSYFGGSLQSPNVLGAAKWASNRQPKG